MFHLDRRALLAAGLAAPAVGAAGQPSVPRTILEIENSHLAPATLNEAALIVIDAQNEYRHGPLALEGFDAAAVKLAGLLGRARKLGTPIIHIAQTGDPGDIFDRKGERGQFVPEATPMAGEVVIEKPLPNSFARTPLQQHLARIGRKPIILAGFMTHMCVSSTARAAYDLDYQITIAADAVATRALPSPMGGDPIPAEVVHRVALAALADIFAVVAPASALG